MGQTTALPFNSVSQVGTNASWSNINNALVVDGNSAQATLFTETVTNTLRFLNPLSGPQIPTGATITEIVITVRSSTSASGGSGTLSVDIGNNATKTASVGIPQVEDVFSGDLAYWGLTQQEALDFANGSVAFDAFYTEVSPAEVFRCFWVTVSFVFEGGIVPPVVLF